MYQLFFKSTTLTNVMSWDRMHFKINPDWTNCRFVTSASNTSNSKDEFSQHQDSSSTDTAIKIVICDTLKCRISGMLLQAQQGSTHAICTIIHNSYHFAQQLLLCKCPSLSSLSIPSNYTYTCMWIQLMIYKFNIIRIFITFVFSRKNIFKGERSISNLLKGNRGIIM